MQSIGGMAVYKSATANQFEGGIAGAANIRLRSPFDAKGVTGTAYIEDRIHKTNGRDATKDKHNPGGGFLVSNRWNSSAGEMGFLLDATFKRDDYADPVQWVDRPTNLFSVRPDGSATRLGDKPPLATAPGEALGQLPNIGGVYYSGKRKRESLHGAFGWKINPQPEASDQYLGMGYQGRNATNYILDNVTWAPRLTNVVLAPQGSHCNTRLGNICPILSANAPAAKFDVGPYDWDPYTATSTWGENEHTATHYLDLGLKYANGPLTLDSRLAYTRSKFYSTARSGWTSCSRRGRCWGTRTIGGRSRGCTPVGRGRILAAGSPERRGTMWRASCCGTSRTDTRYGAARPAKRPGPPDACSAHCSSLHG